jgi:hypothetical protein
VTQRGYWQESDGSRLTRERAYELWASEAHETLTGVAGVYHAVITYGDLAEEMQKASGARTSVPFRHWIGEVLRQVVVRAHKQQRSATG